MKILIVKFFIKHIIKALNKKFNLRNIKEYVDFVRRDKKTYKFLNKFFDLNKNKLDFAIANPTTI